MSSHNSVAARTIVRPLVCAVLLATAAWAPVAAQQSPAPSGEIGATVAGADSRTLLDAIREDLVALRFEKALAAIEALLGNSELSAADRGEGLVLRAQAHGAFGDLDATEQDYREILALRPSYSPDESLTPKKALARFNKVQAEIVGRLRVELDPPRARLTVDGRPVELGADGLLALLAGSHVLRAEQSGHDPVEESIVVEAARETGIRLLLTPNARTVILRTEPEGVAVMLNGVHVGTTARGEAGAGAPAELVLENLPLQEHNFVLSKECYRTERLRDLLTVDLLDRNPKRYKPVSLDPSRSVLNLEGGPAGSEVRIDGAAVSTLPADPIEVCPGRREVEVRFGGRLVWGAEQQLTGGAEVTLAVEPRPNAALIGIDEWPRALADFGAGFNRVAVVPRPSGDLAELATWRGLDLPGDVDLAFAVAPAGRQGARDRRYLYSPILRAVHDLEAPPALLDRPSWATRVWGLTVADSLFGGPGIVVEIVEGGPAAQAGLTPASRLLSIGGRKIEGAADVRSTLQAAAVGRSIEVEWIPPGGAAKKGTLSSRASVALTIAHERADEAMTRAAWAVVDSICSAERADSALANLALLFAEYGHHDLAVESWRRVRWSDRRGVGRGTVQYYLAQALERLGRESAAVEAYTKAAASAATTFDDDGPRVAPAAADRLNDLGVSVE